MAHHSTTGLSLVPGHSGLLALSSSSPVLVAFSSSFDHARHSLSSPKFHEKRLYRGRGHEQRFKAGSIRRLSYFYYRLVSLFLPLRFARTRIGLAAKNRRGGKAGELLRRGESSGWFRWVEKRRRKRGKVG